MSVGIRAYGDAKTAADLDISTTKRQSPGKFAGLVFRRDAGAAPLTLSLFLVKKGWGEFLLNEVTAFVGTAHVVFSDEIKLAVGDNLRFTVTGVIVDNTVSAMLQDQDE